jgi:ABC-type proline/glycine betaine transport system ATPase subunit
MRELILILIQVLACGVIFVTGTLWLNDLPMRMGLRATLRKVGLVLITGAAAFLALQPANAYVCVLLIGVALELVTQRPASWLRWVWKGQPPDDHHGLERRSPRRCA